MNSDIEKYYKNEVKRKYYRGRPTRKYRSYLKKIDSFKKVASRFGVDVDIYQR